jgi:hypothetical protein
MVLNFWQGFLYKCLKIRICTIRNLILIEGRVGLLIIDLTPSEAPVADTSVFWGVQARFQSSPWIAIACGDLGALGIFVRSRIKAVRRSQFLAMRDKYAQAPLVAAPHHYINHRRGPIPC